MNFFDRIPLGGEDQFKLFSLSYFIALAITMASIVVIFILLPKLKNKSYEPVIRWIIALYMLYTTININTFTYLNNLPWYAYIPAGTCGFAIFTGAYALMTKSRLAFKITFFWGWGAFLAIFAPNILEGPGYYFFYQYYLRHLSILVAAMYMYRVFDYQVFKKDYQIYVYITLPLAIVGLVFNYVVNDPEHANVLYMLRPAISGTPLDWFYNIHPLFYSFIWVLIAIVVGYLYYLPFVFKEESGSYYIKKANYEN